MKYALDTNACIALIKGRPDSVRTRFSKAVSSGAEFFVPTIVAFELWYGVFRSEREQFNASRVATFFAGPFTVLPFDEEDAKMSGSLRAALEKTGRPIGAYDTLIAGQAIARELTVVTANVAEFSRIKGLKWQDWAK